MEDIFIKAKNAISKIVTMDDTKISDILNKTADYLVKKSDYIIAENKKDLAAMSIEDPRYDRLLLNKQRIDAIASDMRNVASLPSPRGNILEERRMDNGMLIKKVSVPFGVIGVIYESRPNVSCDVFSLSLKSGNVAILKGGSEAYNSNYAIVESIRSTLRDMDVCEDIVTLMPASREMTAALLEATGYVDLIIPRGGKNLIKYVNENAKVPVIETGAGICHTYFDIYADANMGRDIITNAKTRRVSVCNAMDCLVIHKDRICDLPFLCSMLKDKNVLIYADKESFESLKGYYPDDLLNHANDNSYGTEFLSYTMSIKSVDNIDMAIKHIDRYSSKHSESIVSNDAANISLFTSLVDAACVYVNTPTSFTDGAEFGMGAEIGISTQKLHARGPMALKEITTYKWIIEGKGQIR